MQSKSGTTWLRVALGAWIALTIAASVKTVIEPQLHTVYTAFSHGSRDWWDGNSLYVNRAYYYSPTFAILMTPFAIWPDWFGGILWNFASVGLLVWSLRVFFRDVLADSSVNEMNRQDAKRAKEDRSVENDPTAHGLTLTPHPSPVAPPSLPSETEGAFHLLVLVGTVRSVWSGQSNAILIALVLLAAAAIVRGRLWRASLLLATPIYIKIWPIAVAGLFGVQWPRRLAARIAICVVATGLVPFLTKPAAAVIASYTDWYHCLVNRQATQLRFPGYRDAWTIWEQFQSPVDQRAYVILQVASGLATLGFCLWQCRLGRSTKQLVVYTIAAWCAWQLLFGPGTERLTYNLIAPALAWAVLSAFHARRTRAWIILAYLTTYILGLGGVERLLTGVFPAATALEPIGVLMFAGWLIWNASVHDDSRRRADQFADAGPILATSRAA